MIINNKMITIYDKFNNKYTISNNILNITYIKGFIGYDLLCSLSKNNVMEVNVYLDTVDKFNNLCLILSNFRLKPMNIIFSNIDNDIILDEKAKNYLNKLPDNVNVVGGNTEYTYKLKKEKRL